MAERRSDESRVAYELRKFLDNRRERLSKFDEEQRKRRREKSSENQDEKPTSSGRDRTPVMGSSANINTGRNSPPAAPARRRPARASTGGGRKPTFQTEAVDIPVSPVMPTAGIAGLEGTPSGPALNRMEAPSMPAPIEDFSMPASRMRRGLFGEEIPEDVYEDMERKNRESSFYGRFKKGGSVKKTKAYKKGGSVSSASKRADGCCTKGKTKGRMV